VHAPSLQNPQSHCPLALQVAFGAVVQFDGQGLLVLKQRGPEVPVHWQQTGGVTQPHFPFTSWHCDPAGAVGGQGPLQPVGDAVSL